MCDKYTVAFICKLNQAILVHKDTRIILLSKRAIMVFKIRVFRVVQNSFHYFQHMTTAIFYMKIFDKELDLRKNWISTLIHLSCQVCVTNQTVLNICICSNHLV